MVISDNEMFSLRSGVLNVTSETSDKFVFTPQKDSILGDLLIGLKRFRNTVRWKWFFQEKKRKEKEQDNSPPHKIRSVISLTLMLVKMKAKLRAKMNLMMIMA